MASINRQRARQLFMELADLPKPDQTAALSRLCGNDTTLRAEVEALLRAEMQAGGFMASPTSPEARSDPDAATIGVAMHERVGAQIGRYKLLQQIGEGGFGVVYMAEQREPVQRKVALKIIKLGMDTRNVIARFEQERQALALMDHPHIARVLDAGATDQGRPYFVMELCTGDPITEYCDKNNLNIQDRLHLFIQVCQAVQHAHQKGVIHRDIKPNNVLVSTQDGRAHAKVIDFGIAKATASRLTEKTLFTEHKQFIGTPQSMSPEQAEGMLDIDTRTDVYSLGVLLYEMLTGVTPFDPKSLRNAAYAEMQRIIREVEPLKPSTRLSESTETITRIAATRRVEPKKLGTLIRGDLDWIVMKAMEKDRQRRYETPNGLGLDVQRFLAGEAVLAAPPNASYRMRKFVRRHKGQVLAASVVTVALIAGAAAVMAVQIRANRLLEQKNAKLAEANALAEKRFRQARAAVDEYFTTVSETKLLDVPGLQPIRKELLDAAERYYRDFLQTRGDDPEVRVDAASASFRVGWVKQALGQSEEALKAFKEAAAIYGALVQAHPENIEYQRYLASSYGAQGLLLDGAQRRDDALAAHQKSLEIRRSILAKNVDDVRSNIDVARTLRNIGGVYRGTNKPADALFAWDEALAIAMPLLDRPTFMSPSNIDLTGRRSLSAIVREDLASIQLDRSMVLCETGRQRDALASWTKAIELFETLVRELPNDLSLRGRLADCYSNGADLQHAVGELERSRELRARCLEIRRTMVADNPSVMSYRRALAEDLLSLGHTLSRVQRTEDAIATYKESIAVAENAVQAEPDSAYARNLLAQGLSGCGTLLAEGNRAEEALPLVRRASEIQERLVLEHPEAIFHRSSLGNVLRSVGRAQAAAGNAAMACKSFERAVEVGQPLVESYPVERMNLACNLALMAPVCVPARHDALIEEALKALRQAVMDGYTNVANLRNDPDLKALRERPEFQELLVECERGLQSKIGKAD